MDITEYLKEAAAMTSNAQQLAPLAPNIPACMPTPGKRLKYAAKKRNATKG